MVVLKQRFTGKAKVQRLRAFMQSIKKSVKLAQVFDEDGEVGHDVNGFLERIEQIAGGGDPEGLAIGSRGHDCRDSSIRSGQSVKIRVICGKNLRSAYAARRFIG